MEFKWGKNDLRVATEQSPGQLSSNGSVSKSQTKHPGEGAPLQRQGSSSKSHGSDKEEGSRGTGEIAIEEEADERPGHLQWQGRETTFMSSNAHSRDRTGLWDASGLDGSARSLVTGDEKAAR